MVNNKVPYIQLKIMHFIFRLFYLPEQEQPLYVWHIDSNNRVVWFFTFLFSNWYFQSNNELPQKIKFLSKKIINNNTYHRLIPTNSRFLFCIIVEK